jgi:penicillin-binding protein 1B
MQRRRTLRLLASSIAAIALIAIGVSFTLAWQATREFDLRGWDVPARVFAAPLELYPGRRLTPEALVVELERLGYRTDRDLLRQGSYFRSGAEIRLLTRTFTDARGTHPSQLLKIRFAGDGIRDVSSAENEPILLAELDPLPIGSLFPSHGEDRIVLSPLEVPRLLIEGIKAVEDRRFDDHVGVDLRGIARAVWVNLRAGALEQGASTLTQQLVRNYYLDNEKTFTRKFREALMAIALELRREKSEIALAYVNEVYLGQDGARAIHGFGLAAQYFFGKPLAELELHELALLIGQVRGPSYYDPRRHPQRARARRDRVLEQMFEFELISKTQMAAAAARDLGVTSRRASGYFAGFLDLVRSQLAAGYDPDELETRALTVFTTLDPSVQASAQKAAETQLSALQNGRPSLETAIVVTTPHDAEIKALVGGQRPGFNRAMQARRPVGSLIKPAVYLAALESEQVSLASKIVDGPIEIELVDGSIWAPGNFDPEYRGEITVARALTDSLNAATVRLGMDVGVERTAEMLGRLGLSRRPTPYPSLLLGAVELTPLEIAAAYNTLASGGFHQPLRAVRAVVAADGAPLQRYHIELEQAADPADVYALNTALTEVMRSGTGKTVSQRLPAGLVTAGKTGTSDDYRDSWFAGYSAEYLALVWVGNDANEPIGLTGATGAGRVWADVIGGLTTRSFDPPRPAGVKLAWIDLDSGLVTERSCPHAARIGLRSVDVMPLEARGCGSDRTRLGSRIRRLFDGRLRE